MSDCPTKSSTLKEKLLTFFDESKDIRLKAAQEFSDSFEYCTQNTAYQEILKELYDKSQHLLLQSAPVFVQEYPMQQIRKQCLELFTKVPNSDYNKQYSKIFMNTLMKLIEFENEENTSICVRLLVDIHKTQKPPFSQEVVVFLKFVRNVYKELQHHTNKIFCHSSHYEVESIEEFNIDSKILETFTVTRIITNQKDIKGNRIEFNLLPKSCYSLKVMHEIPVLLVLMYQFHKSYVTNDIALFIPLIMDFLNLMPTEAQKNDSKFNHSLFLDFLAAQVKTLSFLAYVVKFFKKPLVEKYADSLVQGMYRMIRNIPSEVTNMRKEYFIAARHILGVQEIKPRFNKVLSELMDEDILIGNGYTVNQLLRPLAYSTLADLIHFVKNELNLQMIAKATNMYIKNMHDDTLVFSIQQMSMKLLLNFIEPIKNKGSQNSKDYPECRQLLLKILYALVERLGTVRKHYLPRLESECSSEIVEKPSTTEETDVKPKPDDSEQEKAQPPFLFKPEEKPIKPEHVLILPLLNIHDLRTLTKHLVHGIKTITMALTTTLKVVPQQQQQQNPGVIGVIPGPSVPIEPIAMTARYIDGFDVKIYCKFIRNSLRIMDLYLIFFKDNQYYKRTSTPLNAKIIDEKNILESIAHTFLQLSQANFKEVFATQIKFIIKRAITNSCIIQLFQIILNSNQEENPSNSSILANLILSYLLENMEIIGEGNSESNLHVRLFKLIFNSVHNNLGCFENVLELHLKRIVLGCMKYALSAKDPSSFMCLLRYLFRSIGGGAHEKLYKEFLPLLPLMLTGLSRLLRSPHVNQVRDLLGELCVIVPVRLSTLLPHLSLLMEPLVHVLSCSTISQGLRTLELCVDNMSPDYLYQNMYPVRGDIMFTMLQSFKYKSEQVNRTAFKVLGKMGRFNRCDLSECQYIRVDSWNNEKSPEIQIQFNEFPSDTINIPVREIITISTQMLKLEKNEPANKDKYDRLDKAFNFLVHFFVKSMEMLESKLNMEQFNVAQLKTLCVNYAIKSDYTESKWVGVNTSQQFSDNFSSTQTSPSTCSSEDFSNIPTKHEYVKIKEYTIVKDSLVGIIVGCLHENLRKNAIDDLIVMIHQLVYMSMAEQFSYVNNFRSSNPDYQSDLTATELLTDAIADSHAFEDKECARLGSFFVERICEIILSASRTLLDGSRMPIFSLFAHKIVQMLHNSAWYTKWGGCSLLFLLIRFLHPLWLWENLMDFVKALFYTVNDLNMQICQHALTMALDCLELLVEKAFEPDTVKEVQVQQPTEFKHCNSLVTAVSEYAVTLLLCDNDTVREKATKLLRQLCRLTNKSLNALLQPLYHIVSEILPPDAQVFVSYPLSKQIAVIETNYLFGNHVNSGNCVHYEVESENHLKFFVELRNIIETPIGLDDDPNFSGAAASINQSSVAVSAAIPGSSSAGGSTATTTSTSASTGSGLPSSKSYSCSWNIPQQDGGARQSYLSIEQTKNVALKVAACKLLSTLWYLDTEKEKNFQALFKAMCSRHLDVHETAFKCLQEFLSHTPVSLELRNANLKPLLTTFREKYSIATNRQLFYCARLFVASFSERMCESLIVNKIKPNVDFIYDKFAKDGYIDTDSEEKFILLIKTIELFHVLQAASNKYIQTLTEVVLRVEQKIYSYLTSPLRKPLILYLAKCPADTVKLFLHPPLLETFYARNFFLDCLHLPAAKPIRDHLQNQADYLIELLKYKRVGSTLVIAGSSEDSGGDKTLDHNVHHFGLSIIYRLGKINPDWWIGCKKLAEAIKLYWCSQEFGDRMARIDKIHYSHWKDLDHTIYLMLRYIENNPDDYEYLFSIAKAFKIRILGSHHVLRQFITDIGRYKSPVWKQALFRYYIDQAYNKLLSPDFLYLIFSYIILPLFCESLEKIINPAEKEELLGGPPKPNEDSDDIITVFLNKLINNQEYGHGGLKVSYYQFCILILEYAPNYIHEISNKKKGQKARIILTFAWPNLTNQSPFMDLLEKYVGLQTLAYLISKFNISRQIIVRVFTCLAKGNIVEPKKVVNAALGVLVPAWLQRKDDINYLVLHTKKVATDDITSQSHLHIGNLIVRHSDIYYQARSHMQPLLHRFIMKLNNQNFQPEQRRSLLDMLELFIRWDIQAKEDAKTEPGTSALQAEKPLNQSQKESIVNLIIRLLVQTMEHSQTNSIVAESSCRRILRLVEIALHPNVWGPININLDTMARYFKIDMGVTAPNMSAQVQAQYNNMFTCLDLLTSFIKIMNDCNILMNMKIFSKPLCDILATPKISTGRFTKYFGLFLKMLLLKFPAEASNKQKISQYPELIELYNAILKVIQDSFGSYEQKPCTPNSSRVQSALHLLNVTQQVKQNTYAFVDRCLMHLVTMGLKLVSELKTNNQSDEVEQLIGAIEIIKSRFNILGADLRRNKVIRMFQEAISLGKDVKLIRVVINALRGWIKVPKQEEHFAPSNREKSDLFVRLWAKFHAWSDNLEIQKEILSVLLFVFENEQLQVEDVNNTFQVAFCYGFVSNSSEVRGKYLELYLDAVKRSNLLERFVFLISANEWDSRCFKLVNWIPTFLEVLFMDLKADDPFRLKFTDFSVAAAAASSSGGIEKMEDSSIKTELLALNSDFSQMNLKTLDYRQYSLFQTKSLGSDKSFKNSVYEYYRLENFKTMGNHTVLEVEPFCEDHAQKWQSLKKPVTSDIMANILGLCYVTYNISDDVFSNVFLQLWAIMIKRYPDMQDLLKQETVKFVSSHHHNQHIGQSTFNPMTTFFGALSKVPDLMSWLHDSVFTFMSASHNQWFLGTMMLEDCNYHLKTPDKFVYINSYELPPQVKLPCIRTDEFQFSGVYNQNEFFLSLNSMYELLEEEDYQFGLWSERCCLSSDMKGSLAAAQKGHYDVALKMNVDVENQDHGFSSDFKDVVVKQKYYDFNFRYLKKLGHWDALDKYLNAEVVNHYVQAESLWRKGKWQDVYQSAKLSHSAVPEHDRWKSQLIYCYSLIMTRMNLPTPEDESMDPVQIETELQKSTASILQQWKSMPNSSIVTGRHMSLLQACNLAIEGWDALHIFNSLRNNNAMTELKTLIKSWKNRLPHHNDSFSFWTDVVLWRKSVFEKLMQLNNTNDSQRIYRNEIYLLLLELVRTSRKQHLSSCTRYYAEMLKNKLPDLVITSFSCSKQECKIKMYEDGRRNSYVQSLEMLENIDAQRFKDKKDLAKFFCYKAVLFSYFNKGDDATRNFGYALQIDPYNNKIWSIYADFLVNVFSNYPTERRLKASHTTGIFAMTALVEAACPLKPSPATSSASTGNSGGSGSNNQSALQHIKDDRLCCNVAKCLWLVTLDGASLMMAKHLEEVSTKLPAAILLPWARSLCLCLLRPEARHLEPLLLRLSNEYPEAVYQPLKCLRHQIAADEASPDSLLICDSLLAKMRKNNGQKLYMLDEFCHNMEWISINWSEQLYSQLVSINERLEDHMFKLLRTEPSVNFAEEKLPVAFIIELQHLCLLLDFSTEDSSAMETADDQEEDRALTIHRLWGCWLGVTDLEVIGRQYQAYLNSCYCQDVRARFSADFGNLKAMKIRAVLNKLKKVWIPLFQKIISLQPSSCFYDERNQMLLTISKSTCEMSLPGDLNIAKKREHRLNIASFSPVVERIWINNSFARKIVVRASNGHNFEYLTQMGSFESLYTNADIRKCQRSIYKFWLQERIFQLFRVVNESLNKQRESSRREVRLATPRLLELNACGLYLYQMGEGLNPILHKDVYEEHLKYVSLEDISNWHRAEKMEAKEMLSSGDSGSNNGILEDPKRFILRSLSESMSSNFNNSSFEEIKFNKLKESYQKIVSYIGSDTLVRFARKFMRTPEDYWMFRKYLTIDVSVLCLCQWFFNIKSLNPYQYMIDVKKGRLQIIDSSIDINNDVLLSTMPSVPFRLSPSLVKLLQPSDQPDSLWTCSNHPLTATMSISASVLLSCRNNFVALVRAVLRDYLIISDRCEPAGLSRDCLYELTNPHLEEKTTDLVDKIFERISVSSEDENRIKEQIHRAISYENQCQMPLSYQAWV